MRSLHLIDIENLCGGGRVNVSEVVRVLEAYERLTKLRSSGSFVVAGMAHNSDQEFLSGWNKVGFPIFLEPDLAIESGKDGAEIALERWCIGNLNMVASFDEIVLGSGDGRFGKLIIQASELGLRVRVVARNINSTSSVFQNRNLNPRYLESVDSYFSHQ